MYRMIINVKNIFERVSDNRMFKKINILIIIFILTYFVKFTEVTSKNNFDTAFSITFFPVGKGDCIIIKYNQEAIIVDAGFKKNSKDILNYLKQENITDIKAIIATHPHKDHIGGIPDILLSDIKIDTLYQSKNKLDTKQYQALIKTIEITNTFVKEPKLGEQILLGDAILTFIGPLKTDYKNINNSSIVIQVEYASHSILLTGDMLKEAELDLLKSNTNLNSTILKVGHHGNNDASSNAFIQAVNPQYSIITCNLLNMQIPSFNVLNKLKNQNSEILLNDMIGIIKFNISDTGEIKIEKQYNKRLLNFIITIFIIIMFLLWLMLKLVQSDFFLKLLKVNKPYYFLI
jgi:Predicted hydrolase (metallo-beta-lactamase superfamily)